MNLPMKTIKFRPLRRIKKTGKITVASYMQWVKVKRADYSEFNLVLLDDYKDFNPDEYIYNHEGKQLFFYQYMPDEVPVFQNSIVCDLDEIRLNNAMYGIQWSGGSISYHAKGTDCDGVPIFSHLTDDNVATHYNNMNDFEPLTVRTVVFWVGWFLYNLNKSNLKAG